ncbi:MULTISPECIES: hypothetical protein [Streptomyces]|uniref:Uncharacterized protein n=1 Tax=Streptomyces coelicoflavus TaxID=285562 RepID=A0A6N9UTP9_9ACTN|nr:MULTISPECIES: hypothetical protein [Streptomyces]NEB19590.1 hypothetical protein [Streptomyces coelicoflavus]
MAMNVVGLFGWVGGWVLLFGVSVYSADWLVWVFLPYFVYAPYRALTQLRYFPEALSMLRILRTYGWQCVTEVPYGLTDRPDISSRHYGWFELPNPARPEQRLPMVFTRHLRLEWWSRRMAPRAKPYLKAQIEEIWFAGDPRFIGVIAAFSRSAYPRHMHVIEQRMHCPPAGECLDDWGAGPDDISRGRRAAGDSIAP